MIKRKITPHIIALATFFIVGSASAAGTWYVDPAGNDSNTCTAPGPASACMTINAAIGKASAGDTIHVAIGLYNEQVQVNKTLTLLGAQNGVDARTRSGAESTITNSCGPVQIMANSVVLDGFTIQGSNLDPTTNPQCFGAGVWTNPPFSGTQGGHQILNNIIQNNITGIELDNTGAIAALVQHNLIQTNNNPGAGSGNGIQTNFGLVNATIDGNKFSGQTSSSELLLFGASPITISNNPLDAGMVMFLSAGISITGNTSIGTKADGTIYIGGAVSGVTVSSNVLNGGLEGVVLEDIYTVGPNSNVTISPNNCIAGNTTNGMRVAHLGYAGAAHSLNATNNWWNAASGPKYNGAGTGTGDNIADPDLVVNFSPFLTSK